MKTMTPEAVAFIDQLKTIDVSLAMFAEVRIDGGATLEDTIEKFRGAMRFVEAERAKSPELLRELRDEVRDWQEALCGERDGLDELCDRVDQHLNAVERVDVGGES